MNIEFKDAYINNKPSFKKRNMAGVYFIRRKGTQDIIYIGRSCYCVYKALYRHFHKWNDVIYRVVFNKKEPLEIGIIICYNKNDAIPLEAEMILNYQPALNKDKMDRYKDYDFTIKENKEDILPF